MDIPDLRTWIFLYLISSVALLWAAFLSAQGVLLGMSIILVIVVIGANFIVVFAEIRRSAKRKEMMQRLSRVEIISHDEKDG
jgi:Flp pilus assembly protein TadB